MGKTLTIKNLQLRNDTSANWLSINPVLAKGEMGIEIDTRKFKFGDGATTWDALNYASSEDIEVDDAFDAESENPIQNKVVNDAVHYTNDTPIITAIGGISVGTTFNNMSVTDVLTKLLYPYTKPVTSISVTPNGGTYERGTSVSVTALKVTATKKSSAIASVVAKQGSTVITTLTENVAGGGTFNVLPADGITLTADATFTGTTTDVDGGSTSATSSKFTFVDPYYYGVVADGATIDGSIVNSLTKDIKAKGAKTYTYTTEGECMVIAYPASYGELKSAVDPNGFENIGSYTKYEVKVTTASNAEVSYYVYVKTASSVTDFAIKYGY